MPEFRGRRRLCITDEERKERNRESKKRWADKHTEYFREYFADRYRNDPEFREKCMARNKKRNIKEKPEQTLEPVVPQAAESETDETDEGNPEKLTFAS